MNIVNYITHIAKEHVREMEEKFHDEIRQSIRYTREYKNDCNKTVDKERLTTSNQFPKLRIIDTDSVTALYTSDYDDHIGMLNFASYKSPGGRFIEGSRAQEEAICHESTLYNVLKEYEDSFYKPNRERLNHALYHSNLLYVPGVVFERNDIVKLCDVITCAAPNKGVARRYNMVSEEEYLTELRDRIDSVLFSAYDNNIQCLILGAFGCGVFKNDPEDVANVFKEFIDGKYAGAFKEIIFPIPKDNKSVNLEVFRNVFNK